MGEKFGERDAEGSGNVKQVEDGNVAASTFDVCYETAVKAHFFSQP